MRINLNQIEKIFIKQLINNSKVANEGKESSNSGLVNHQSSGMNVAHNNRIMQDIKYEAMTNFQMMSLIKDVLSMPKEWSNLLILLAQTPDNNIKNILKLLNSNQNIDIDKLKTLLMNNSKDVLDKLIKLANNNPANTQVMDQLKDVTALISLVVPKSSSSTQEVIQNSLLMYLPWYPLNQDKELLKEFMDASSENKNNNDSLVVFLSTENLGRFKVSVFSGIDDEIGINIENHASEPDKEILKKIVSKIKRDLTDTKIKNDIQLEVKDLANDENAVKQIFISESANTKPAILISVHVILNTIFNTDEKISKINN